MLKMAAPEEEEFKVILIGESGVGKTSFVIRYADGKFQTGTHTGPPHLMQHVDVVSALRLLVQQNNVFESTVGVDNRKVCLVLDDIPVILQIWDTAGQERFKSIVQRFFRSAHGAIVMYDVTNKSTFDCVPWWLDTLRQTLSNIPIILVGNKCDDDAQLEVIEELAKDFAEEERLYLFHTSAKDDVNVKQVFESLATMMLSDRRRAKEPGERTPLMDSGSLEGSRNIRLTSQSTAPKKSCCSYLETPSKGYVV